MSPVPLGILGLLPPNTPSVLKGKIPINAITTIDKVTYRVAADWQVAPQSLLYANYETGFHGGGFSFAKGLESYDPKTFVAFTVGSRTGSSTVACSSTYWKYKNQQLSQFGYDLWTPPLLVFYTFNIGKSTIKGADVDLDVLVTPTTRLSGSAQYLDTTTTISSPSR